MSLRNNYILEIKPTQNQSSSHPDQPAQPAHEFYLQDDKFYRCVLPVIFARPDQTDNNHV